MSNVTANGGYRILDFYGLSIKESTADAPVVAGGVFARVLDCFSDLDKPIVMNNLNLIYYEENENEVAGPAVPLPIGGLGGDDVPIVIGPEVNTDPVPVVEYVGATFIDSGSVSVGANTITFCFGVHSEAGAEESDPENISLYKVTVNKNNSIYYDKVSASGGSSSSTFTFDITDYATAGTVSGARDAFLTAYEAYQAGSLVMIKNGSKILGPLVYAAVSGVSPSISVQLCYFINNTTYRWHNANASNVITLNDYKVSDIAYTGLVSQTPTANIATGATSADLEVNSSTSISLASFLSSMSSGSDIKSGQLKVAYCNVLVTDVDKTLSSEPVLMCVMIGTFPSNRYTITIAPATTANTTYNFTVDKADHTLDWTDPTTYTVGIKISR